MINSVPIENKTVKNDTIPAESEATINYTIPIENEDDAMNYITSINKTTMNGTTSLENEATMNDIIPLENQSAINGTTPIEIEAATNDTTPFGNEVKNRRRPLLPQVILATVAYLTAICNGLTAGFSTILLSQLRAHAEDISVDKSTESWIVSLYLMGTAVGCLSSGFILDTWGRRLSAQVSALVICIGWIVMSVASSHHLLFVGRALGGFGRGINSPANFYHLEEMADPRLRGALSACILLFYSIGIMVVSLLGTHMGWRIVAGLGAGTSLLNVLLYSFLRESPVWLVHKNRINEASEVYSWLWGSTRPMQAERDLQELLNRINEDNASIPNSSSKWICKQYFRPQVMKPFFIIHIFSLIQVLCGSNLFIFYTVDILSGLKTDGSLDVNLTTNLTSIVRVAFMVVSCATLVYVGRRPMSISSGLGSGIVAVVLGTLIHVQTVPAWVMIVCVLLYVAFNTYGYFVLPTIMVGEILPSKVRCVFGGYIFTMNDMAMFGATKLFPSVHTAIGSAGLFWLFGVFSLFCCLFVYLLLPETKGRSLVQIERYFLMNNILWLTRNKIKK
ncbi:facilitated trehalose transporter Tret1-like isoform X2 [Periplaneta americana]